VYHDSDHLKKNIQIAISDLKKLPKKKGTNNIYYPGEISSKIRMKNVKSGSIEIDKNIWEKITKLLKK